MGKNVQVRLKIFGLSCWGSCTRRVTQTFLKKFKCSSAFFTIMRVSFCVTQISLNFNRGGNESVIAQFSKYYMPLNIPFTKLIKLLTPIVLHNYFAHCGGCIVIFDGLWMEIIIQKTLSQVLRTLIWRNFLVRPFFIHKSCPWLGNIMNSQW